MTRWLAVPLAAMLVACADAGLPERPAPYQFSIDCSADPRCSDDAPPLLTFHWPLASLPVRLWVQPGTDLRQPVGAGALLWIEAGLYGEMRAAFVSDSQFADVLIFQGPAVSLGGIDGNPALDCMGTTSLDIALDTTIVLPFRTIISPRLGARREEIQRCYRIVAAHELGHALGLLVESADPGDLMYAQPTVENLSLRDRASFTSLYHTRPTIRVPSGR